MIKPPHFYAVDSEIYHFMAPVRHDPALFINRPSMPYG